MKRLTAQIAALVLLLLALAPSATASTLCVDRDGCAPGSTYTDLEPALAAAASKLGHDEILLGAGVFSGPFHYNSAQPVSIVGEGPTTTVLGPGSGLITLSLLGGAGEVADLRIRVANAGDALGLETDGVAKGLEVIHTGMIGGVHGALLRVGGRFEGGLVTLDHGTAIETEATTANAAVRDSTLLAEHLGLNVKSGQMLAERLRIDGSLTALRTGNFATLRVNHVAATPRSSGNGISVGAGSTVEGRHLTLVGAGGNDRGLDVTAFGGVTSTASLESSVIAGFGEAVHRSSPPGFGTTLVTLSRTAWAGPVVSEGPGYIVSPGSIPDAELPMAELRPLAGSDAIDAADPSEPAPFDLDGLARVLDGDGDGIARADLGAYELQPPAGAPGGGGPGAGPALDAVPPSIARLRVTPRRLGVVPAARARARVRFALSEAATVTLGLQRLRSKRWAPLGRQVRLGGRTGANSVRLPRRFARLAADPARYRLVAVAADAAGNRSARARARFALVPTNTDKENPR